MNNKTSELIVTFKQRQPVYHALCVAINHFATTSDKIGDGMFSEFRDGRIAVLVSVNLYNTIDCMNFKRLQARLEFVAPELKRRGINVALERLPGEPTESRPFELYQLHVPKERIQLLTVAGVLAKGSEPLGWGTEKPLADTFLAINPFHSRIFSEAIALAGP